MNIIKLIQDQTENELEPRREWRWLHESYLSRNFIWTNVSRLMELYFFFLLCAFVSWCWNHSFKNRFGSLKFSKKTVVSIHGEDVHSKNFPLQSLTSMSSPSFSRSLFDFVSQSLAAFLFSIAFSCSCTAFVMSDFFWSKTFFNRSSCDSRSLQALRASWKKISVT